MMGFMNVIMRLVLVMRLLLRHSVQWHKDRDRKQDLPPCIIRLFEQLELEEDEFERIVWHELYLFRDVDGQIQGFDDEGQKQVLAWADMGEIFRFLHYERNQLRRYQVTVMAHSLEPLFTEQDKARGVEKMLGLDTTLGDHVSKTFEVHRTLFPKDSSVVEMRECRSRHSVNSDKVECNTERRLYRYSSSSLDGDDNDDRMLVLERRKWWEGDKNRKPRQEHEEWYDNSNSIYKTIERDVNELGDATERIYIRGHTKPSINFVQRYADDSGNASVPRNRRARNVRHRYAATASAASADPVLYVMPHHTTS